MKIVLIKDVPGVGRAGDLKQVNDGYARNFLLKKNLAVAATDGLVSKIRKEQAEHQAQLARQTERLLRLRDELAAKTITIAAKADKGKLFAGIHQADILDHLRAMSGLELTEKQISIKQPIKTTGEHTAELKLGNGLTAKIRINVQPK